MPRGQFLRQQGLKRNKSVRDMYTRFFEKVRLQDDGCWIWEGARAKAGYGTFNLGRRDAGYTTAHAFTYTLIFGSVPPGKEIDHLCRIRHCCNPWHLDAVPHRVNVMRGEHPCVRVHRTGFCKRGHRRIKKNMRKVGETWACNLCIKMRRRAISAARSSLHNVTHLCPICTLSFAPITSNQKYCSSTCVNTQRRQKYATLIQRKSP